MNNSLEIGGIVVGEDKTKKLTAHMKNSISTDGLSVDTLDAQVDFSEEWPTIFQPSDADAIVTADWKIVGVRPYVTLQTADPSAYQYGETVNFSHIGPYAKMYLASKPDRIGGTLRDLWCESAIGLLDRSNHMGGMYTGQPVDEVIEDVIGGTIEYSIDPLYAKIPIYGHLPVAKRRKNLHWLLFATGLSVLKDSSGNVLFGAIDTTRIKTIPNNRIYRGGSIAPSAGKTRAVIAEHNYIQLNTTQETVLFEGNVPAGEITAPNGDTVTGIIVTFKEPMHSLRVEGGSLVTGHRNCNYAILAPASNCTLYGKPYVHTTRQVVRQSTDAFDPEKVNEAKSTANTLVCIANSENVAERVFSYYSQAETVKMAIVLDNERPGDVVRFDDPFGVESLGIIKSLDITTSHTDKATVEMIRSYTPIAPGNFYKNSTRFTSNGTFTVPEGVFKILVVLVGGGDGGWSGCQGERATWASQRDGNGGAGGLPGAGGNGGKIYIITIAVTPGQTFSVFIGAGGEGAVCTGEESVAGANGSPTTFGTYSSDLGSASAIGYNDTFGGRTYGKPGGSGIAGGKGGGANGPAEDVIYTAWGLTHLAGKNGTSVSSGSSFANGGYGGGAGSGGPGRDGTNGKAEVWGGAMQWSAGDGGDGGVGEYGANGGNPGDGGWGGGGGGGGGAPGGIKAANIFSVGSRGYGGIGGKGGNGKSGIAIVYF